MRTIIHDLKDLNFLKIKDTDYVVNNKNVKSCIGCFNCWVKTPMECCLNDDIKFNGKKLLDSDELIIISRCVCGFYSSIVKKILERSISYVEPFFTLRNNEIHHLERINKKLKLKVYFYGETSEKDKIIATNLVEENKKNLNISDSNVYFLKDIKELNL